jgi:hypothetical protein
LNGRLYLSPLRESMEEYALRDVNGAKVTPNPTTPKPYLHPT